MVLLSSRGYCAAAAISLAFVLPVAAQAQSLEEFYRGKQLNMIIGYPTGGSNDITPARSRATSASTFPATRR